MNYEVLSRFFCIFIILMSNIYFGYVFLKQVFRLIFFMRIIID